MKDREDNFKNALFINYGGLGDEILFLPAIEDFKRRYPECKITLCLEGRAKGIKQITDLIDEIIEVDIKAPGGKKYLNVLNMIFKAGRGKFDVVISSGKSPLVAIILFLTGIKRRSGYLTKTAFLLTDGAELNEGQYAGNMYHDLVLPFVEDGECSDSRHDSVEEASKEDFSAEVFVPHLKADNDFVLPDSLKNLEGGFIALHPGVSKMSIDKGIFKCPDVSFWNEVIKGVLNKGKTLVLLGGPDDKDVIEKITADREIIKNPGFINMFGKTKNLRDLMNIIARSRGFICADSAPLHIAVGLGINIIAVFGPTNENKLVPNLENIHTVVNKEIDCRPCLWHKRGVNCSQSLCLNLKADDVLNLIY